MGCGKSSNQSSVRNGEVVQPKEMDQSKIKQDNLSKDHQQQNQILKESKEDSSQHDQIILLNNQYDKQMNTHSTSYYPNGQPNATFGKTDKYSRQSMNFLYFFGVNQINEQQILRFDVQNKSFENLYDKIHKFQKENVNIYNYMMCQQIDDDNIFLCGGINQELSEIQSDTYILNTKTMEFQKYSNIITARYTHFGLINENKVYCFGGRSYGDDEQAILNSCEVFDLKTHSWLFHPPLNIPRCTAMAFMYNNTIYVAGGYSGPDKRTKKIEKFNNKTQSWDILDFKLHRGLEGSFFLASKTHNELITFGGFSAGGATSSITSIDLQEKSIRYKGRMIKQRVLHKAVINGQQLYIFGGDEANIVETVDLNTYQSSIITVKTNFTDYCDQFEIEKYSAASKTQEIFYLVDINNQITSNSHYDNINKPEVEEKQDINNYHLLGTDDQPFLLQFSGLEENNFIVKSVPTNLKLSCYQGGCRLNSNEVFLAGGISFSMNQVQNKCFIYNFDKKKVTKVAPLINQRYAFNCIYMKETQEIYVIGGRTYSNTYDDDALSVGDASKDDPNLLLQKLTENDQQRSSQIQQNDKSLKHSQIHHKQQDELGQSRLQKSQLQNRSKIMQKESQVFQKNSSTHLHSDVLTQCEKLDLKNQKWTSIDPLKRPRSSASSFIYFGKIYVYGGYHGDGGSIYKSVNMESYDRKSNRWEEHTITFDVSIPSLEATQIIQKKDNQNQFLIFGGQIDQQASNKIWQLDILNLEQAEKALMKCTRFLHKIAHLSNNENPNQDKIIIFGGNKDSLIEFYENNQDHQEKDDQIIKYINDILQNNIGDSLMKKYLLL